MLDTLNQITNEYYPVLTSVMLGMDADWSESVLEDE